MRGAVSAFFLLLFLLLFSTTETKKKDILRDGDEEVYDLKDVLLELIKNYDGRIRKMAIQQTAVDYQYVKIIENLNIPVVVNANEIFFYGNDIDTREPSEVVLVVGHMINVSRILNSNLWTSYTRFILICIGNISESMVRRSFQDFWKENIVNVIFLSRINSDVIVFSYDPYLTNNCGSVNIVEINVKENKLLGETEMKNLHGCILNVSVVDMPPMVIFNENANKTGTFHLEGTEASVVQEISKKLNFKARFSTASDKAAWGQIFPFPLGTIGEVFLKKSHFGIGLLATSLERYIYLDMTVPVSPFQECVTLAVPSGSAKKQAAWIEIYVNKFSPTLWCAILIAFILSTLLYWIVAKVFESPSYLDVSIYMFSAFLNVPLKPPPQTPLKSFFMMWVWYSLVVSISYQSLIGSKLTVPYRPREIETMHDLLESNLRCTGLFNTFKLVVNKPEGDLKKLASRFEVTDYDMKEAVHRIVFDKDIAYMRDSTSFKYFLMKNPYAKGRIYFLKECISEYYPIMILQKNSPLTKITNQVILRLFESGILLNWRRRYIPGNVYIPPSIIQLTLQHMLSPFTALLCGLFVSTIVFFFEWYSIFKRNN